VSELYYQNLPEINSDKEARKLMHLTYEGFQPYFDFLTKNQRKIEEKIIHLDLEKVDINEIILEEIKNIEIEEGLDKEKLSIEDFESHFDKLFKKFLKKIRKKNSVVYKIVEEDTEIFDKNKDQLFNAEVIYFSSNIYRQTQTEIIGVYPPYNLVVFGYIPSKHSKDKNLRIYIRSNTYVLNTIKASLKILQDTPKSHNRALLKLIEDKDFVNFESIPIENNIKDNEWIFLKYKERDGTNIQREFVEIALNTPDFAILEGPPGSGKTTTICEIIYQAIKRNQKILLVASTHVAVDNVLEKLFDEESDCIDEIKRNILPIRIGRQDNWKISDLASKFQYENFWEEERKILLNFLEELEKPTKAQKTFLGFLRKKQESNSIAKSFLRAANLVCGTTIGILRHPDIGSLRHTKEKIIRPFDMVILDEASKTTFQEFLVSALVAKKFIIVGDIMQLPPYIEEEGLASNIEYFISENSDLVNLHHNLQSVTPREIQPRCLIIEENKTKLERYQLLEKHYGVPVTVIGNEKSPNIEEMWGSTIIVGSKSNIEKHQDKLPASLSLIKNTYNDELKHLNEKKNINLDGFSYKNTVFQKKYNNLTFSLSNQDESWGSSISWRLNREFEHRFLSKNIYENQIISRIPKWLTKNEREKLLHDIDDIKKIAFPSIIELLQKGFKSKYRKKEKTVLNDGFNRSSIKNRHRILKYQHRMHPDISKFSRKEFYNENALVDFPGILRERKFSYPDYQARVCWLDVRIPKKRSKKRDDRNRNLYEVQAILRELRSLSKWTQNNAKNGKDLWEVAILPFYKSQENLFRQHLQKFFKSYRHRNFVDKRSNLKVELCVIDRFQGHEADIVFLSLVQNKRIGFLDCPNRLNVALTRAKYQTIIAGNRNYFHKRKHRSDLLRRLADSIDENDVKKYWD